MLFISILRENFCIHLLTKKHPISRVYIKNYITY
jgi:hypothetical protein